MTDQITPLSSEQISKFLSTTDLFSNIPRSVLDEIAQELKLTYLAGGDILFDQYEIGDSLYLVMYGFLHVIKAEALGKKKIIAELGAGNVVGEIACLVDVPRTATIYAVRDSILLQMTRKTFDMFVQKYPEAMMGIMRQSVKRLVSGTLHDKTNRITCFSLLPSAGFTGISDFCQLFVKKLSKYGETFLLTQSIFDEIHGKDASQIPLDSSRSTSILSWIQELESKYSYIVYVAEELNEWAIRCIRQSDKILLIGQYGDSPKLNELEQLACIEHPNKISNVDLVLLANSSIKLAYGAHAWFEHRNLNQHYNVRVYKDSDLNRLIRLITGNGLGLVMGGGGATGLAHIGLIRALEEYNIPIDYIGGTSMGALIGGLLALELDYKSIIKVLKNVFHNFSSNIDYTLPITSLLKGRFLSELIKDSYGENTKIEDLWCNFFCISTNISTNELCVHEDGLLWRAIRSSTSLPAIFPPVHDKGNYVYVDGGILNNLPVDMMQERINDGKIFASALQIKKTISTTEFEDETISGWYLFLKHILMPKFWKNYTQPKKNFISIGSVIHNSMSLGSNKHQQKMLNRADYKLIIDIKSYGLLNFKPMQEIIDIGYHQAVKALQDTDLISKVKDVDTRR